MGPGDGEGNDDEQVGEFVRVGDMGVLDIVSQDASLKA
jgi:hypothetical protein